MRYLYGFCVFIFLSAILWIITSPDPAITVGGPVHFQAAPDAIRAVQSETDYIADNLEVIRSDMPGYDEIVWIDNGRLGYATGVDGWIWEIDRQAGTMRRFLDVPLMPAGARLAPDNPDRLYFCASYLHGEDYPVSERVGLYQLDISTRIVTPLVLNVPRVPIPPNGERVVYIPESRPALREGDITADNSRPVKFCNDLDVSVDGQRIYFTEPFAYGTPSMGGGGTFRAALSLGQQGYIWQFDRSDKSIRLIAQNFIFPDGILVETELGADESEMDASLLITETVNFNLLRLFISGERAGAYDMLWENLPGMPDGLDRDEQGRIWTGLLKIRTSTFDWIHKNPWIKPLLLRLPYGMMPVSKDTAILAFSPDASETLYYTEHDGSRLSGIAVVIPGKDALYLATVGAESHGLYSVPMPPAMQSSDGP